MKDWYIGEHYKTLRYPPEPSGHESGTVEWSGDISGQLGGQGEHQAVAMATVAMAAG